MLAHQCQRMLIDLIEIRPFLAIDFDVDEERVHPLGDLRAFEAFMRHHMAPMAGGIADREQDLLNPISVNVLRAVPGSGFVVWGARTFGSDASWRYVPVRRMAIFLRT